MSCVGDANGDGYADVAIGDGTNNRTNLFFGGQLGLQTTPTPIPAPPQAVRGPEPTGVGDSDGDGYADLAISEVYNSGDLANPTNHVWIFPGSGPPTGVATSSSVELSSGSVPNGSYGFHNCVTATDLDGDRVSDVVIGQCYAPSATDAAIFVFRGSGRTGVSVTPMSTIVGPDGGHFGKVGAADVDGDGHGDIIVGAGESGRAYVYQGSSTGLGTSPSSSLTGGAHFGYVIASSAVLSFPASHLADVPVGRRVFNFARWIDNLIFPRPAPPAVFFLCS